MDTDILKSLYCSSFKKYGQSSYSILYDELPIDRYRELIKIDDLNLKSILDVGCGLGNMYEFIKTQGLVVDYTGIDLVKEFINEATKKYPEAKFLEANILEENLNKKYDYVLLQGVFNNKLTDGGIYLEHMITEAFKYCNYGMAFNFISTYTNFKTDDMEYHSPERILKFCIENLSYKVSLKHHLCKCDTVIYVYK